MSGPYDVGWVPWLIVVGVFLVLGGALVVVKELVDRKKRYRK